MKDYINRVKELDQKLNEETRLISTAKLKRGAGLALASIGVAIGLQLVPPTGKESKIEGIVAQYQKHKDFLYESSLPLLNNETADGIINQSVGDGLVVKDPFTPNETLIFFYAREPSDNKLVEAARPHIQREFDGGVGLSKEYGSIQRTLDTSPGFSLNSAINREASFARYDPSQAYELALKAKRHAPDMKIADFERFIVYHEAAHAHPLMRKLQPDQSERVCDVGALVYRAQQTHDKNSALHLARGVKLWRQNNTHDQTAMPNGSFDTLQRLMRTNLIAIQSIPAHHIIPFAHQLDLMHQHQQSPTTEQINALLKDAGAVMINEKFTKQEPQQESRLSTNARTGINL